MKAFSDSSINRPALDSQASGESSSNFCIMETLRLGLQRIERQLPISVKIGVPLVAITLGSAALLSFRTTGIIQKQLKESYFAQAHQLAAVVEAELSSHIDDKASMDRFLEKLKSAKLSVKHVRVYRMINGQPGLWASADPGELEKAYELEEEDKQPLLYGTQSEIEDAEKEQLEVDIPLRINGKVAAAVGVYIDLKPRNQATKSAAHHIFMQAFINSILQIGILLFIFYWAVLHRLSRLSKATSLVAAGDLNVHLPEGNQNRGRDEVFNVAREFDRMLVAVRQRTDEILNKNHELKATQDQLAQLNSELRGQSDDLQQSFQELHETQSQLIHTEKMAALGQLVAGIAHEINTPLGAIQASISNITSAQEQSLINLLHLIQSLPSHLIEDFFKLLELARQPQDMLSSREERQLRKMLKQELSAQGLLHAHIFAENLSKMGISTALDSFMPLFQAPNAPLIFETASQLSTIRNNSQNIQYAVERASKIVYALKTYVRQDSTNTAIKAPLATGIDSILTLYHSQLRRGVEVIKQYDPVPEVLCYPEEILQVWSNLISNAIQAMDYSGTLEIKLFQQGDYAVTQFLDHGCGISEDIRAKIFEPFFTTKISGEGSGLGLSIVSKIIEKHCGKIEVESKDGPTIFRVWLPLNFQSLAVTEEEN